MTPFLKITPEAAERMWRVKPFQKGAYKMLVFDMRTYMGNWGFKIVQGEHKSLKFQ